MTKHECTNTNKEIVMRLLNKHGGRTIHELVQASGLTKHQVRTALQDLKQSANVYLEKSSWYPSASAYAPILNSRIWNKSLLQGVVS